RPCYFLWPARRPPLIDSFVYFVCFVGNSIEFDLQAGMAHETHGTHESLQNAPLNAGAGRGSFWFMLGFRRSMPPDVDAALRGFNRTLAAGLLCFWEAVAEAASAATGGGVEGRVLNGTNGLYLTNARVAIEGTDLVRFTNEGG